MSVIFEVDRLWQIFVVRQLGDRFWQIFVQILISLRPTRVIHGLKLNFFLLNSSFPTLVIDREDVTFIHFQELAEQNQLFSNL